MSWSTGLLSAAARENLALRLYTLAKIPLLFYIRLRVAERTPARMVVEVPLKRRNRNHLGSMYFGALCMGAECAAGVFAMHIIRERRLPVSMVFREFHAEFLKRAEGRVHFACEQGREIAQLVARAAETGERVEQAFDVTATVPESGPEPVARFKVTLSLKRRG